MQEYYERAEELNSWNLWDRMVRLLWIIPFMMRRQQAFNKVVFILRKDIEEDFRAKPWGTGQAVLAARTCSMNRLPLSMRTITMEKEAFRQLHDWLLLDHEDSTIAMAGFIFEEYVVRQWRCDQESLQVAEGHTHVINVETSNVKSV